VGLFATQVPTGVVTSRDIGVMRVLVDNVEQKISKSNWEAFQQEHTMRNGLDMMTNRHTHLQVANTDVVTGGAVFGIVGAARYAYLDFDPTRDGKYVLQTRGRSRVHMRIEAETTFTAIRALPLELIAPGG
jgi:hypothetical protein